MTEEISPKPQKPKHKAAIFAVILILLITGAALIQYLWPDLGKNLLNAYQPQSQHTMQLPSTETALATELETIQHRINQQQQLIQSLEEKLNQKPQTKIIQKTIDWKPIATEYCVRMANTTLQTNNDIKTAVAFLLEAKQYLDNDKFPELNKALSQDILTLRTAPDADTAALILKLEMIGKQITQLPIIASKTKTTPDQTPPELSKLQQTLNKLLKNTLGALKDIVIIRRQTTVPLPSLTESANIPLHIQLKLLQAQMTIIYKQNQMFHELLTQLTNLIKHYYPDNNDTTNKILQVLEELQQTNIQPATPKPISALPIIEKYVKNNDNV